MSSSRPTTASLAEVVDRILEKGVIIDLWTRLALSGIEAITVEARLTIGSVDTFLHYAKEITEFESSSDR